ncbi:endonuclease/exonuclease/phosphatase family protein [Arthrobacter sulfonylureivorans]|uniref:endonuclease/exonuclease/phosphatase family protein n=1 Tax=Arthrobacter sulfonylureivorans TaxID=2486855 RepID=UPI0039E5D936
MSFNIHNGSDDEDELDLAAIARDIHASGADIIGLQEVDRHKSRSKFVDQAAWLARRLGMYFVYGVNVERPPRDGQKKRSQYGTAILSKYRIVSSRNYLLRNIRYKEDPSQQRGLLEAVIDLGGVQLRFYNTHLDHRRAEQRRLQINQVLALAGASDLPTVLAGDFNTVPGAPEMRQVTAKFMDTFAERGHGTGFSFPAERPSRRIDYLLISGQFQVVRASVMDTDSSDHRPVVADLTWPHCAVGTPAVGPQPVWF